MKRHAFLFSFGMVFIVFQACEHFEPVAPAENALLDGPVEGLSPAENIRFLKGDVAFNDDVFTASNGLGPLFVATTCGTCHPGDGKGHPFTTLTRFGQYDGTGNQYAHLGGPQLQHRALPGFAPEVLPDNVGFSKLTPPANTGLGFLDAVRDADIMAWADPNDNDGDGISGVPNWIVMKEYITARDGTIEHEGKYIGRFGKKAAAYDLHQQTAQAYNEDIGITSTYEPMDTHSGLLIDPEITDQTIHDVVFYLKTLKAPIPRAAHRDEIISGKAVFEQIGCAKCHRSEMKTGDSPIAAIANKTFHPYTDLLLHDMGADLDDGYTEGSATTSEWRTPALWGLGLSKFSQGGDYFLLHDGRAKSIDEAILWHGGEAANARAQYKSLTSTEKNKLIQFLESL
ncbi:di-heme oxidoredictase family protein [Pseudochryseolinea flava]|uniref:Thiol oxidoreductase n=1 Tax=Pseudochryseolinea flava TaxID=2059302 RepID=A0A364XWH8_9BACT|nr:di-heme oxidoredictase family protein [Pseudochryseolinea flava]RAV97875.1 thiol oxidoreductase [Pseudochryseolinea flava]